MSTTDDARNVLTGTTLNDVNAVSDLASREREMIERICAGEKHLFYQLMKPYERSVFVAARSVLQHDEDAEEAAQDGVLKAFTHLYQFRGDAKFSTWLIQIVINEARMKKRKDRKHLYDSLDETSTDDDQNYRPMDFADWREIPSEALETKEVRGALKTAISSLSPIYREVFMLRDVEQMSITETAAALGITEASVKTRLLRARLQVRDALAPGYNGKWAAIEAARAKVKSL